MSDTAKWETQKRVVDRLYDAIELSKREGINVDSLVYVCAMDILEWFGSETKYVDEAIEKHKLSVEGVNT